jgi:hypothetical protein
VTDDSDQDDLVRHKFRSACPSCGDVADRTVYDIGSGPEVSCASCEWCWGVLGQSLQPIHDPEEFER